VFDIQEKLEAIEGKLAALKEDPKEQIVFEYFDFLNWVRSKLKRKTFLELKQEELRVA
jgi:hypothetical protein